MVQSLQRWLVTHGWVNHVPVSPQAMLIDQVWTLICRTVVYHPRTCGWDYWFIKPCSLTKCGHSYAELSRHIHKLRQVDWFGTWFKHMEYPRVKAGAQAPLSGSHAGHAGLYRSPPDFLNTVQWWQLRCMNRKQRSSCHNRDLHLKKKKKAKPGCTVMLIFVPQGDAVWIWFTSPKRN